MDSPEENKEATGYRLCLINGRGVLVLAQVFDHRGRIVRPDLLPPSLQRLNREGRRRLRFKRGAR